MRLFHQFALHSIRREMHLQRIRSILDQLLRRIKINETIQTTSRRGSQKDTIPSSSHYQLPNRPLVSHRGVRLLDSLGPQIGYENRGMRSVAGWSGVVESVRNDKRAGRRGRVGLKDGEHAREGDWLKRYRSSAFSFHRWFRLSATLVSQPLSSLICQHLRSSIPPNNGYKEKERGEREKERERKQGLVIGGQRTNPDNRS